MEEVLVHVGGVTSESGTRPGRRLLVRKLAGYVVPLFERPFNPPVNRERFRHVERERERAICDLFADTCEAHQSVQSSRIRKSAYRLQIEVATRYASLSADQEAFPLFADPGKSARQAKAWSLGLNWYLNRNVKLVFAYEQTDFEGAAPGVTFDTEKLFQQRFQLRF